MKKLIFGCTLMLVGIIGFAGCLIAETSLVQPGAWSGFLNLFFDDLESFIILAFFAISIVGTVIAVKALKTC